MTTKYVGKLTMEGCGHCDNLKPNWEKLEKELCDQHGGRYNKKQNNNVKIEFIPEIQAGEKEEEQLKKINETHSTTVSVQGGYPTIYKIEEHKVSYYEGNRDGEEGYNSMKKWILSNGRQSGGTRRRYRRRKNTRRNRRNR